ncbi:hypothetical protein WR25_10492 isoform I [Diploscapter pachys]|uniref:Endoplasmic reticulum lectin 1 n=1 Tax=Diploscapter pachys TaxID=2018661 RepID=A0A2A2JYR9_9BILA|nr:hypothetical protein WR25_10492 isoform I [Diploscapter pachys]
MKILIWVLLVGACFSSHIDDTVHYYFTFKESADKIKDAEKIESKVAVPEEMKIRTKSNEQFTCRLPIGTGENDAENELINYDGPSPKELLEKIYKEKKCSFLIDTYWTYELCHGKYVVQFHEQMTVRGVYKTEYYLGNYAVDYSNLKDRSNEFDPPKRLLQGENYPYFSVLYTQGTTCDLTGKPRTIEVLYICAQNEKARILSITETSSCKYEMIVMTELLCKHPKYKLTAKKDFEITCYNEDGSKPLSLQKLTDFHDETFKRVSFRNVRKDHNFRKEIKFQEFTITHEEDWDDDIDNEKYDEIFYEQYKTGPKYPDQTAYKFAGEKRFISPDTLANSKSIVEHTVNNILTGRECIFGGQGWWQYQICYGNRVLQYHVEPDGQRTEITLGLFDEEVHKAWVDEKPKERQPKKFDGRITQISHMYTKGDLCDAVKAHRSIEVRIRCQPESQAQSSLAISLSLHEPKTCQYILIVESARFCEPLQYADDHGLIALKPVEDESQKNIPEPLRPDP